MSGLAISDVFLEKIAKGEVILFLGAGATFGATGRNGEVPINGNTLRDKISDEFLGGAMKDRPLAQVAEYAKSETSIRDVQKFIYDLFEPLEPAKFHELIPKFRWHSIVTTNYDLVVERAYSKVHNSLQKIGPITKEGDPVNQTLRDNEKVPYLKLHGCISDINEDSRPLILASEEYAKYLQNRKRLFSNFQDWAREYPVIFCGYDIADPNIQQILFSLTDSGIHRSRYAVVKRNFSDVEINYWSSKRITPIPSSFQDFLEYLDRAIAESTRTLSALISSDKSSIAKWVVRGSPSSKLLTYIDSELEHVRPDMSLAGVDPESFYKGAANNWAAIEQDLDIYRSVTDDLLIDAVLESHKRDEPDIFLLKGYAGSGKSITLRRFAWDAANLNDALVFWLSSGSVLRRGLLCELCELTDERVIVVIEDCIAHIRDIEAVLEFGKRNSLNVTFLLGARSNEWNAAGEVLDPQVAGVYELRNLSEKEINELLKKLDHYGCLEGISNLELEAQQEFFILSSHRQLLVALHEANYGKKFEDIVLDEFKNLVPREAQSLYLDVCTLNRFNVGIRAGLLSRISGVTFNYFQSHLLEPLEHVVNTYYDSVSRDYAYRSRHPVIADLVFNQVLADQEERSNQLVRIIGCMNVDYQSDEIAFNHLMRGRELAELFANRAHADRVFDAALDSGAPVGFIEHQKAVFELNHPGGRIDFALTALDRAEKDVGYRRSSLMHTKATVLRRQAKNSSSRVEKEKLRADARDILKRQLKTTKSSHPFDSLGRVILDEIEEKLQAIGEQGIEEGLSERVFSNLFAEVEKVLANGLERFPDDSFLLALEADIADGLKDEPRATRVLEKAFEKNPAEVYLAVRLSRQYVASDDSEKANETLRKCLERNPMARKAHFLLAENLIKQGALDNQEIRSHLRSSFTDGDSNYNAQFWFARQEWLDGSKEIAKKYFESLANAKVGPKVRNTHRGHLRDTSGKLKSYEGLVTNRRDSFCFISVPDYGADVFIHRNDFHSDDWDAVALRSRVKFGIAFNFKGPAGVDAEVSR